MSLNQNENYTKYTCKITTILKNNTYVEYESWDGVINVQTKDKRLAKIAPWIWKYIVRKLFLFHPHEVFQFMNFPTNILLYFELFNGISKISIKTGVTTLLLNFSWVSSTFIIREVFNITICNLNHSEWLQLYSKCFKFLDMSYMLRVVPERLFNLFKGDFPKCQEL